MSDSTTGLLAAIEGYSAEHGASKEHEPNIKLLQRVAGELKTNKASDTASSPGAREAKAAAQTNMAAEEDHSGGEGNKTTNRPGSFGASEGAADPQDGSNGTMDRTGPQSSDGHLHSNLTGPAAKSGVVDIRRDAALKALESERSSGGNAKANTPGKAAANEARIGDVKAPAKAPADRNTNPDSFEKVPNRVGKEPVGDGWGKAATKARKMFAGF